MENPNLGDWWDPITRTIGRQGRPSRTPARIHLVWCLGDSAMSALVARRALSLVRALGAAGARAEHTAAATGSGALQEASFPTKDPIMLPFYEKIAGMQMHPAAGPHESSPSETAVRPCHRLLLPVSAFACCAPGILGCP